MISMIYWESCLQVTKLNAKIKFNMKLMHYNQIQYICIISKIENSYM